jgi:hypothetical protein
MFCQLPRRPWLENALNTTIELLPFSSVALLLQQQRQQHKSPPSCPPTVH